MKKKPSEQQSADELLQQLQKSYLSEEPEHTSDSAGEDAEDAAFRHRIAGLLKRFSGGNDKKSKHKKDRKPDPLPKSEPTAENKPEPTAEDVAQVEPVIEAEPEAVEPITEADPVVKTEAETVAEPETAAEPEAGQAAEEPEEIAMPEPEPPEKSEAKVDQVIESEPEAEPEMIAETVTKSEPEAVPESEPEAEPESEPEIEPEPVSAEPIQKEVDPGADLWAPPSVRLRGEVSRPPFKFIKKQEQAAEVEPRQAKPMPQAETPQEEPVPETPAAAPAEEIPSEAPTAAPVEETALPQEQAATEPEPESEPEPEEQSAPEQASSAEPPRSKGLSGNDIDMILELGYENELGRLVGPELLKEIKNKHARRVRASQKAPFDTAPGYRGKEYAGKEERERILSAYLHDRLFLILRLVATVTCILGMLITDLPMWFGPLVANPADENPLLFAVFGMLLLCIAAAIQWRRLRSGADGLLHLTPTPDTPAAVLVCVTLLYDVIRIFNARNEQLPALNLCAAGALLFCLFCDCIRIANELRTFRLLSGEEEKTVLDPTEPGKKMVRQGKRTVKIINDEIDKSFYRVRRAKEAVGFFRRSNGSSYATRPVSILLILSLSLSVIVGVAGAVLSGTVQIALTAAAVTFFLTLPGTVTLFLFAPLDAANRKLALRGCALIGEESVEELADPGTLIFEDTDLFAARRTAQASLRQSDDLRGDLRLCEILFRKIGGTLGSVGRARSDGSDDPQVLLLRIEDHGVEALIDGKDRVLAGNAEFLARYGLSVPTESTDLTLLRTPNTALLYIAVNGSLKLHYEISYQTDPSFEELAHLLAESKIQTAIHTYDPNLCDAFLQSVREPDAPHVRVIKPGRYEDSEPVEASDTGAVSINGGGVLVAPIRAAQAICRLRRIGFRILLAMLLPGAALALGGALFLPTSTLSLFPLFALAWRGLMDLICLPLDAGFLQTETIFGSSPDIFTTVDHT